MRLHSKVDWKTPTWPRLLWELGRVPAPRRNVLLMTFLATGYYMDGRIVTRLSAAEELEVEKLYAQFRADHPDLIEPQELYDLLAILPRQLGFAAKHADYIRPKCPADPQARHLAVVTAAREERSPTAMVYLNDLLALMQRHKDATWFFAAGRDYRTRPLVLLSMAEGSYGELLGAIQPLDPGGFAERGPESLPAGYTLQEGGPVPTYSLAATLAVRGNTPEPPGNNSVAGTALPTDTEEKPTVTNEMPQQPQVPADEAADQEALASLDKKLAMLRDDVMAVVHRHQTGLYLWGDPGVGKSFQVTTLLEAEEAAYKLFNSHMTAKGLFRALQNAPDAIHFLEDMERITADRDAQGILRSALWAQPGHDRVVTWTTDKHGEERVVFRGGLVMISNRPLHKIAELKALASRIIVRRLVVTDDEIRAHMRRIAKAGHKGDGWTIDPDKTQEICEFVLEACRKAACTPDLRMLVNACSAYRQWDVGNARCDWHDLVTSRIQETISQFRHEIKTSGKEEQMREERQLVRELREQYQHLETQIAEWKHRTDKSVPTFYRGWRRSSPASSRRAPRAC